MTVAITAIRNARVKTGTNTATITAESEICPSTVGCRSVISLEPSSVEREREREIIGGRGREEGIVNLQSTTGFFLIA